MGAGSASLGGLPHTLRGNRGGIKIGSGRARATRHESNRDGMVPPATSPEGMGPMADKKKPTKQSKSGSGDKKK